MNSHSKIIEETVDTVETVFEIYLCDNCEAELYSKDAYDVSNLVFYDQLYPMHFRMWLKFYRRSIAISYQMKYLEKISERSVHCDAMFSELCVDSMKKS